MRTFHVWTHFQTHVRTLCCPAGKEAPVSKPSMFGPSSGKASSPASAVAAEAAPKQDQDSLKVRSALVDM